MNNEKIRIRTVEDFIALSEEQFERISKSFCLLYFAAKDLKAQHENISFPFFEWIDDGKDELTHIVVLENDSENFTRYVLENPISEDLKPIEDNPNDKIVNRILEIGNYKFYEDNVNGKPATPEAVDDAISFARGLPKSIHCPIVSLASDGEVNFLWTLQNFRLDLGFCGDGTFSYFGKDSMENEVSHDCEYVYKGLPGEVLKFLRIASE